MSSIAFIDIDGVIADCTERLKRAEAAKQAFLNDPKTLLRPDEVAQKQATQLYWDTVFTPSLLDLDTLIPGAPEHIERLEALGYTIIFLTSRPERMEAAIVEWLDDYGITITGRSLVTKYDQFQFTKTLAWKAGTIRMLDYMLEASSILLIDDEPGLRKVLQGYGYRVAATLAEAI